MGKNKNYRIIAVLFLMVPFSAIAQEYAFKVLVNKGKNEVRTGESWEPIKTGAKLKSSDELRIVDNSYVGLIHVNGRPLEIKHAGKYKVVDLSAKVGTGNTVLNKYTDFILSSNENKVNRLSATGAVHRGEDDAKIYLPKPENATVYNDSVVLSWQKDVDPVTYVISMKSMFGDNLLEKETTDTTLTITLADPAFANEDNIMVQIYPKSKPEKKQDPAYMLKRISAEEKARIKAMLTEISADKMELSALNKLVLAGFYEQNNLLVDAGTAYLQAIQLAPDVSEYQDTYEQFLKRNAMK